MVLRIVRSVVLIISVIKLFLFLSGVEIDFKLEDASSLSAGSIAGITIFTIAVVFIVFVVLITKKGKKHKFTSLSGMELPTADNLKN